MPLGLSILYHDHRGVHEGARQGFEGVERHVVVDLGVVDFEGEGLVEGIFMSENIDDLCNIDLS